MRRIRYQVACSLDGYIADADGGYDWIPRDPDVDFEALFDQFDVLLMGRKTYELLEESGETFGKRIVVLSTSLRPEDHPDVTILCGDVVSAVDGLRNEKGKDIWLFGGGETFRSLLAMRRVDTVELALQPVLLGSGIPFLPPPAKGASLRFVDQRVYPKSGTVTLRYDVEQ